MKETIKEELLEHIYDHPKDNRNHFNMFNEDYYIIGYYQCREWLKKHDLDVFEAIRLCNEFEEDHYGEIQTKFDNEEILVNNLVYWYGLDLCYELDLPSE